MNPAAVGLILLGAGLRFWRLDLRGFWHDEAAGLARALAPDLAAVTAAPPLVEPPAFYWVHHLWLMQGTDEATARALSACVSAFGLALAWALLARTLRGPAGVRLAALALLACSPFQVLYAQEARPYACVEVLAWAGLWAVLRADGRRGWRALGAGCFAVAGLMHFTALAWVPAAALLLALAGGPFRPAAELGWAALAAGPGLVEAWRRAGAVALATAVSPVRVDPAAFALGTGQLFGAGAWVPAALAAPALGAFALAAGAGLLLARRGPERAALFAGGLLPPALVWLAHRAGALHAPKIRYALPAQLFLLAAAARGAWAAPGRAGKAAALTLLLGCELAALAGYFGGGFPALDLPPTRKPLREAAALIRREAQPGDAVAAVELSAFTPLRFYLAGALPLGYLVADPIMPPAEIAAQGAAVPVARLAAGHRRLWLVDAPVHYRDPLDAPDFIVAALRRIGRLESERDLPGIRIQCWRLAP